MAGFKSDENKQLFIKGLREANFTQAEIDREVQDIEGAPAPATPAVSAPPPVSTAPPPSVANSSPPPVSAAAPAASVKKDEPSPFALDTTAPARQLKEMEQAREAQGKTLMDSIIPTGDLFPPSRENLPVYGLGVGAALTGYGLYKGSKEIGLGLKSRFFGPKDQAAARVEPTSSDRLPAAAQQPTTHEQWIANLSPEERTLYERSEEAKATRANALQSTRNEPFLEPERPVIAPETAPQTPEQIRQAKQTAATQAAQQSMAAPPPVNTPKKVWEPPTASLALNAPATPTQTAATTATETPAPKATLEQQVKVIKETATPIPTPEKQPPEKAPPKPKMKLPEGWGKGMSWLTTVHGVDGARAFIDQYNDGKPFATHKEMDDKYREVTIRPKYSDIPKDIRKERRIPLRVDLTAVPPPSLRPSEIGQGGGSLIRSLTDPLQLKQ